MQSLFKTPLVMQILMQNSRLRTQMLQIELVERLLNSQTTQLPNIKFKNFISFWNIFENE